MKKRFMSVLVLAVIAVAGSGSLLSAQMMKVDIPFEFKVEDKVLSAGTYEIRHEKGSSSLTLKNLDTSEMTRVPFITRLSKRPDREGSVAFDEANGASYLSEVYLPRVDGFHLQGAPGEHDHSTRHASH
jgi:hypothetical protein